jgi:membrane associated rhomboid family serine protease
VVIPVHDINPTRRTPWVTYALIAINVIVFLFTPAARGGLSGGTSLSDVCSQEAFFEQYGAVPDEMVDNKAQQIVPNGTVGVGPNGPGCVVGPPAYTKIPVLSVLTAMFLHGGWLHLLGNMLFLWVFGNNVEDRLGRLRYLLFYLFSGYVAAYGFALAFPHSAEPLIGASGAIAGVLGAYLVLWPRARVWSLVPFLFFIPLRLPAWIVLGLWFVLQWLYSSGLGVSQGSGVAYLAHVFGFLVGVLLALPLRRRRIPPWQQQQWPQQGWPSRGWAPTSPQRPQWPAGWQQPGWEQRWPASRWEQSGQTGWLSEQPESGEPPPRGPAAP